VLGWALKKVLTEEELSQLVFTLGMLTANAFCWNDRVEQIFTSDPSSLLVNYLIYCGLLYGVTIVYLLIVGSFIWILRYTIAQYALFALLALVAIMTFADSGNRHQDCWLTMGRSGLVCE
jgi:hypothetical protein